MAKLEKNLNWLENWLFEIQQHVVIGGKSFKWRDVISSVLGPILFLVYVNDIDEELTCMVSKFPDDTKITSILTTTTKKIKLQFNLDVLVS